ncbi:TatD family hydrolase, partial [Stenotrophomonas sp. 3diitr2024]|uniref:TatD family hydrolase n=1 Tax=Stenotrophomonas sp. 3diitr2024 TaxID=3345115 RepID=UPI0035C956C0
GVHPHHAVEYTEECDAEMRALHAHPEVVAVGECGLDYFRDFSPLSDQHREMMDAVLTGDPERARAAAHAHLEFVHTTLRTLDDNEARRARASRLPSPHG